MAAIPIAFSSFDEMVDALRSKGIDVDNFDTIGGKTLRHLYEEHQSTEMYLMFDDDAARVLRVAFTAAVLVRVPKQRKHLIEVKREFHNGRVVEKRKEWSITETRKKVPTITEEFLEKLREIKMFDQLAQMQELRRYPVESLTDTAIRGLSEELGIVIADSSQLKIDVPRHGHTFPYYRSTAYHQIWSKTHIERFVCDLKVIPWHLRAKTVVHRDSGTKITLEWQDY